MADTEIAQAEELIEKAKHLDANVAKSEAKLTEATSAMAQKEFKSALELAQESKRLAQNTLDDHVSMVIDSVKNLLKLAGEIGIKVPDMAESLSKSDEYVKEGKYEEALDLAKKGWEVVDKLINERVSKDFTKAQSLIVLAKKIGQDVTEMEGLLDKAREHTEKSDYESALKFIGECLRTAAKFSADEISRLIDKSISQIELAKRMGGEIANAEDLYLKAKSALEENNFETAKDYADKSLAETEKFLVKGGASLLRQCEERIKEAKSINAEVTKASLLLNKAKDSQKSGNFVEVYEFSNQIKEEVENAQFQAVLKTISLSRPKFITAKNIGADLVESMKYLDMSRRALKEKKFQEAMEYARKGENTINGVIGNYEGAKEELQLISKALSRAAKIGVDTTSITDMMKEAKKAFDAKDYKEAMILISKCREKIEPAMYERTSEIVEMTGDFINIGEKTQADMKIAKDFLNQALAALKSHDYEKAIELSERCRKNAGEGLRLGITTEMKKFAEIISSMEDGEVKVQCVELLTGAKREMDNDNYDKSYKLVVDCKTQIEQLEKTKLDAVGDGISTLREMKGYTTEYEKMFKETREHFEKKNHRETLLLSSKILQDINNQQEKIATEMLVGIGENLKKARDMGIDITEQTRRLAEAREAIGSKMFKDAYKIMTQSNEEALSFIERHNGLSGSLGSMKSRLEEANKKGIDINVLSKKLFSAENALKSGNFEIAEGNLEEINSEIEQLTTRHSINEKLAFSKECIAIAKSLDLNTGEVELGHKKSLIYLNNGQFENAVESAKKTAEDAEELCNLKISEMLSNAYSMIIEAKKIGLDVLTVEVLYQKAEEALALRRYEKAAKYATQSLDEIEEIRDESQRSANIIHLAGNYIQEAENIKADVTEAKKLLEKAFSELKNNEYIASIELGKKCIRSAKLAKEKKVSDAISLFNSIIDKAKKEGVDVAKAEKLLEESKVALADEDYNEALRLAMYSESELERADLQKKMAVEIISVTAAKLKDAEKKGITVDNVRKLLMDAANALKNNDYIKALESALESGIGLTEATEEYERALSTLHAAQARVNESGNIGVRVEKAKELLDTAKKAFEKKDYSTSMKFGKETIREAKRAYEDHLYKPISGSEELIAVAQDLGVDVTRANNMLSEAKAALEEESFSQVALFSEKCKRLVEREITKTLFEKLSAAKAQLSEAKSNGVDTNEAQVLLKIGESSLESKNYIEAAKNFKAFSDTLEFVMTGKRPEPKAPAKVKEEEPEDEELIETEQVVEKKSLSEYIDDLEARIHKISRVGINTKNAERILNEARSYMEREPQRAQELREEAESALESEIVQRSPNLSVELDLDDITDREKTHNITLTVHNSGKSVAKSVKFTVQGTDFEVLGLENINVLKANEKREIPITVKALSSGDLSFIIDISYIRIFDQEEIKAQISKKLRIDEKEVFDGPFKKYKAETTVKCFACNGKIKPGFMLIHCSCGNTYHDACGGRLGNCPMCGVEFKKKVSAKKKLALRVG